MEYLPCQLVHTCLYMRKYCDSLTCVSMPTHHWQLSVWKYDACMHVLDSVKKTSTPFDLPVPVLQKKRIIYTSWFGMVFKSITLAFIFHTFTRHKFWISQDDSARDLLQLHTYTLRACVFVLWSKQKIGLFQINIITTEAIKPISPIIFSRKFSKMAGTRSLAAKTS